MSAKCNNIYENYYYFRHVISYSDNFLDKISYVMLFLMIAEYQGDNNGSSV
jgi:hypothetical protein